MSFIEEIKDRAKKDIKTIILPEAEDIRVIEAASKIANQGFAKVILLGNEEQVKKDAKEKELDLQNVEIINPVTSNKKEEYANQLFELRKKKGMTVEEARKLMLEPIYYGMMMLKNEEADGLVSGAAHSTANTLRPALQIIKTAPDSKLVSTCFLMVVPNCEYGHNGTFVFGDCGLEQNPDAEKLAAIAASSSKSFETFTGEKAITAMLSHSTMGSAKHEHIDKVVEAVKIAKEQYPEYNIDGEMQLDAAIVPSVASSKAPESKVAGKANTLIFPDLDAGNIGYKLVQRLANAEAYGPITQGIRKPVNDLSRGCSTEDIVGVVAITAVQAQK